MNRTVIVVKVRAGAKERGISTGPDGIFLVRTQRPPENGLANEDVTSILADHFEVSKSQIELISGQTSKIKRFAVTK